MSQRREAPQKPYINRRSFERVFWNPWVDPEIDRRLLSGKLREYPDLWAFQVVWKRKGADPQVRLDHEVRAELIVRPLREIPAIPGSTASLDDVEVEKITLSDRNDQDCSHITCVKSRGKWFCKFNFQPDFDLEIWQHLPGFKVIEGEAASGEIGVAPRIERTDFALTKQVMHLKPCEKCGRLMIDVRSDKKHCSRCRRRVSHEKKLKKDPDYDKRRQKDLRARKREN